MVNARAKFLTPMKHTKMVLKCSDATEAASWQHFAYAYARDVGLSGLIALHVANTAARLVMHALHREGDMTMELSISETPRPALQLRAYDPANDEDLLPVDLLVDARLEPDSEGNTVLIMTWPLDSTRHDAARTIELSADNSLRN